MKKQELIDRLKNLVNEIEAAAMINKFEFSEGIICDSFTPDMPSSPSHVSYFDKKAVEIRVCWSPVDENAK